MSKYETTTHTPGPWKADGFLVMSTDRQPGAIISTEGYHSIGADLANARLIAAAPELLDALKGLLEVMGAYIDVDQVANGDITESVAKARAAIAKAKATD